MEGSGKVTLSGGKTSFEAGETFTITVHPDEGYALKSVLLDNMDKFHYICTDDNINWRCIMPPTDTTLHVGFNRVGGPSFVGLGLRLDSRLGVKFYMDLPKIDGVDYSQSYMEFMIGEQKGARADYDSQKWERIGEKKYWVFVCGVSAIQMAEPITATFYYGDGETEKCTNASVQEYVRLLKAQAEENPGIYSDEVITLANAIIDYGYYAQPYLSGVNQWVLGEDYQQVDKNLVAARSYDWYEIQYLVENYMFEVKLERCVD